MFEPSLLYRFRDEYRGVPARDGYDGAAPWCAGVVRLNARRAGRTCAPPQEDADLDLLTPVIRASFWGFPGAAAPSRSWAEETIGSGLAGQTALVKKAREKKMLQRSATSE